MPIVYGIPLGLSPPGWASSQIVAIAGRHGKAPGRPGAVGVSSAFQECAISAWQCSNSGCQIQNRNFLRAKQYAQTSYSSSHKAL